MINEPTIHRLSKPTKSADTTDAKLQPMPEPEPTSSVASGVVTFSTKPGDYPVFNAVAPFRGGHLIAFINGVYSTDDAEEIDYLRKEHVARGQIIEQSA